jgi:N-acetylglucosamine-6-sulfatase
MCGTVHRTGLRNVLGLGALYCILLALCIIRSVQATATAAESPPRPNIVVVLVDDLRWDELGCMGHPFVKTPCIDRLAHEGLLCRNAFVVVPLCSPSRASFLTGLYAHSHGILDNTNRSARSHQLVTFPRVLHDAGYETGWIGKWHMGNDPTPRPGFDYWVGQPGQGESIDPNLYEEGKLAKVHGYVTDIFNDRAVSFVRRRHSKPFLLYLSHKGIHPNITQNDDGSVSNPAADNFIPAPRHEKLYADAQIARRPNAEDRLEGKPALTRRVEGVPPLGPGTGSSDNAILGRLRMLASIDEGVGQVYQALEQTGQLDNTVFVFTSDEGYFNGEHHLSVERRLAYEESIRIPLLVRYPPLVRPGSTLDPMVLNIDLAPTLLELSGTGASMPVHGRSLVPLLRGQPVPWRTSFLVEYFTDTVFPRVRNMGYTAVRGERYKYIHYNELTGMDELYDLQADPYEMQNLISAPSAQATLGQMQAELEKLRSEAK